MGSSFIFGCALSMSLTQPIATYRPPHPSRSLRPSPCMPLSQTLDALNPRQAAVHQSGKVPSRRR